MTQFSSAINYYNSVAGEWEPFIETFKVHFTLNEDSRTNKKMFQCELPTTLSINITERLVNNLSETYKSWQASNNEEILAQEEIDKS